MVACPKDRRLLNPLAASGGYKSGLLGRETVTNLPSSRIKNHRFAVQQSTALALLLASFPTSQALAQSAEPEAERVGVEEIIVTARKRAESMQQVPIAISALSAAQLEQRDVQSVMDLSSVVPNFQAPKNTVSFSAPQFYLRGAGRANNNWNAENAVAVFVDDIY
ncbi:MAG: hypothetical protein CFE32_17410, partial [Alphaproteobacteria bacterium PA3]